MFLSLNYYESGSLDIVRSVDPCGLPPQTIEAFRSLIQSGSVIYRSPVDVPLRRPVELIWNCMPRSTAVADFVFAGRLASTSALFRHPHRSADLRAARVFADRLRPSDHDLVQRIGEDLRRLANQPVICSIIRDPDGGTEGEIDLIVELQDCLAAAFFTRRADAPDAAIHDTIPLTSAVLQFAIEDTTPQET